MLSGSSIDIVATCSDPKYIEGLHYLQQIEHYKISTVVFL